jgi:hypothetical protein
LHESKKLFHSEGNNQWSEETADGLTDKICKSHI